MYDMKQETIKDLKVLLRCVEDLNVAFDQWNMASPEAKLDTSLDLAKAIGSVRGQAIVVKIGVKYL